MKMPFYERFIELCKARSIKPTPALKDMGFSTGNLQKWQNPDTAVTIDTLEKIAEYFGVSPVYFFSDDIRNAELIANAELTELILDEIARCEANLHRLREIYKKLQKKRGA